MVPNLTCRGEEWWVRWGRANVNISKFAVALTGILLSSPEKNKEEGTKQTFGLFWGLIATHSTRESNLKSIINIASANTLIHSSSCAVRRAKPKNQRIRTWDSTVWEVIGIPANSISVDYMVGYIRLWPWCLLKQHFTNFRPDQRSPGSNGQALDDLIHSLYCIKHMSKCPILDKTSKHVRFVSPFVCPRRLPCLWRGSTTNQLTDF